MRVVAALALSLLVVGPSLAQEPGPATVLGSDKLMVNGTVFRLNGLAAVELHQSCFVDGQVWACGAAATRALQTLVDGVMVTCTPTGQTSGDVTYAVCTAAGQDIGEAMVRDGWAVANPSQSDAYVGVEKTARDAAQGIWRGLFLPPSDFREDRAAIEKSYLEQASASILAEAEKTLEAATSLDIFADAHLATVGPQDNGEMSDEEIRIRSLSPGFVDDAIDPQEIFSWPAVGRVLEKWRQSVVASVIAGARSPIWDGLLSHKRRFETVIGEDEYYRTLRRYAAPWIEQGRQPVLLTPPSMPGWVARWFSAAPPEGATVEKKEGIGQAGYVGTIDGISVYAGTPMPTDNSILLPEDLLVSATYRTNANDAILTLDPNSVTASQLLFHYSIALEWKPDEVVWLHYPLEDKE